MRLAGLSKYLRSTLEKENSEMTLLKEAKLKILIILVIFMKGKILKNETREQKFDCAYKSSIYRIF